MRGGAAEGRGEHGCGLWRVACRCLRAEGILCFAGSSLEEPETLGFAAVRCGFREAAMRQQSPVQTQHLETQYSAAPRRLAATENYLAYTSSSAFPRRCRSPPAPPHRPGNRRTRSAAKTRRRSRIRSVARRGRKQAWPSTQPAATPTHLQNRARLQLQRCAASARAPSRPAPQTAPPRGQPRKEHRARRRRIHLQLT